MAPSPRMVREAAILAELDKAAGEYRQAHSAFEITRQNREAAKAKFGAVHRLAKEVLLGPQWHSWQFENLDLILIGADIGDAIAAILESLRIPADPDRSFRRIVIAPSTRS